MVQIAIGVIALLAAIIRVDNEYFWFGITSLCFIWAVLGIAMLRIRGGIRKNSISLKTAGNLIGDNGLPRINENSFADIIAKLILAIGILGFFIGLLNILIS